MPKVHPSDISAHDKCPWRFRLMKIDKVKFTDGEGETPFGYLFGRAMHDVIEMTYKHMVRIQHVGPTHVPKIIEAAMTAAELACDKHGIDEDARTEFYEQVVDYLMRRDTFTYESVLGIEGWASAKLESGITINCRYDRAERMQMQQGMTCMIIDLKARESRETQNLDEDPQALISMICARKNWPHFEHYGFQHHYTGGRDERGIVREAVEIDFLARAKSTEYFDKHQAMYQGPWEAREGPYCKWCPFQGGCPTQGNEVPLGWPEPDSLVLADPV